MKKSNRGILLSLVSGIILLAAGVTILFSNLGMITLNWQMVVGPAFAIGGLVFLLVFITNTEEWWALIPGFVLIGLGINTFMGKWLDSYDGRLGSAVFLAFVGIPFLLIYIFNNQHWWAIIPGGVLLTIGAINLVPPGNAALEGGLFFLGLAVTFGLVYILPKPSGKLKWALYPAGILLLIGFIVTLGASDWLGLVGPLVLLIAGGYVIYRALRK